MVLFVTVAVCCCKKKPVGGAGGGPKSTSRSAKASSPMTALFYTQRVAGQCCVYRVLYIPLEP